MASGLSAISSAYADSDSEEEKEGIESKEEDQDVIPVGVFVKFAGRSTLEDGVPTDFANVKVKEEPLDDEEVVATADLDITENNTINENKDTEGGDVDMAIELYTGNGEQTYRGNDKKISSDDDSSGTSDSEPDSDLEGDSDESESGPRKGKGEPPKVKGEMSYKDLPPIEDLHISVPHEQCKAIGVIKSVVDPLVVVEAFPNTPALDIDSVLFLDEGDRALGKVYDVIGPVKQPFYCVRFNSLEHIEKNKVEPKMLVYCAPTTKHTSYVFVAQLRKMKGTDASWLDDIETPADEQEFSDDDQERAVKKKGRRKGRKNGGGEGGPPGYQPLQVPGFRPHPPSHRPFIRAAGRRGRGRGFQPHQSNWHPGMNYAAGPGMGYPPGAYPGPGGWPYNGQPGWGAPRHHGPQAWGYGPQPPLPPPPPS